MNNKGQTIIDNLIMGIVAITIFALLLATFWPMTANFITMANTSPNYNLWSPIANMWPVFAILMVIIVFIRKTQSPPQAMPPSYG